jgi:hypothetical protein
MENPTWASPWRSAAFTKSVKLAAFYTAVTHEEWICVWEIYYWIYIGYGDISTILGIY